MITTKRASAIIGAVAGASLALSSAGTALAQTNTETTVVENGTQQSVSSQVITTAATTQVKANAALGTFSWTQDVSTPNTVIAHRFAQASKTLCGSTSDAIVNNNPLDWQLSVTGDVTNEFTISIGDLAKDESVTQTMSCTCGGNQADGIAIAFAQTQGIPVSSIIQRAGAKAGANTITFVCSDGTEVAMPLAYAVGHHAVISYAVNGEDLSASVGGSNQLWLKGTSGNYFARDIVEVRVSEEENPPAAPGEGVDYPNSPNVGVIDADVEADVA